MSTHYLIDTHKTPWADPTNDTRILDVVQTTDGRSRMNGGMVVRVPDEISVRNPDGIFKPTTGLIAQKYASMLANHAVYTDIVYDPFLDTSGINIGASRGSFGERGNIKMRYSTTSFDELIQTQIVTLPFAPSEGVLTYELYDVLYEGNATQGLTRTYKEVPIFEGNLVPSLSFDGGANFQVWTPEVNYPVISPPGSGTQLVVRWSHGGTGSYPVPANRYIGGWAFIF